MSLRLIQRFGRSLTITRGSTPGTFVNGKFVAGTPNTVTIIGSLQPLTAEEQEFAPEGSDEKERRKLYTTSELKIQKAGSGAEVQEADKLTQDGKTFQVIHIEPHLYPGKMTIQYFKAIVEEL